MVPAPNARTAPTATANTGAGHALATAALPRGSDRRRFHRSESGLRAECSHSSITILVV